jgi:hypothetical protein
MGTGMSKPVGVFLRAVLAALAFGAAYMTPFAATALSYSAKPISLVVVDAETKQPIEGVIALVVWKLQNTDGGGGIFWVFEEAVGDKQGHVMFPGWGPKVVPSTTIGELKLRLGPDQPTIYLFKSGYPFGVVGNDWESWMLGNSAWTGDLVRASIWDNKTVEIRRFVGAERQYLAGLSSTASRMPLHACQWANFPRFTAALVRERGDRFDSSEFESLPTIKYLKSDAAYVSGCPGTQAIERYLK